MVSNTQGCQNGILKNKEILKIRKSQKIFWKIRNSWFIRNFGIPEYKKQDGVDGEQYKKQDDVDGEQYKKQDGYTKDFMPFLCHIT